MTVKRCSKCRETKRVVGFSKDRSTKDGLRYWCKECMKTGNARWRAANPEKAKAGWGTYYAKNAEKHRIYNTRYRAENPEKVKAARAKWCAKNPEKVKATAAKYRARNRERFRAYQSCRRSREVGAEGIATAEQIIARWEVYGNTCYICGSPAEATDHVKPLTAGGSNWPANLRPICHHCNSVKGATWDSTIQNKIQQEAGGDGEAG